MLYFFLTICLLLNLSMGTSSAAVVDFSQIAPTTQGSQTLHQATSPSVASSQLSALSEIALGQELVRGVIAQARVVPLRVQPPGSENLPENGNYRVFLTFREAKSGRQLLKGQAAVRLFAADDRTLNTVRLVAEEHAWSCAIFLPEKGETMMKVGSQLDDGKKRIFRFFVRPESSLQ